MAKLYRKKRVSNAYGYRLDGMVQWFSAYEVGHVLYQATLPLPMDAPLHMQQGYAKAMKEQDLVWVADFKRLYRLGLVMPLPEYRYMVKGIVPFMFGTRAQYPNKRGQSERLPMHARLHAAQLRKRYVKLAFG